MSGTTEINERDKPFWLGLIVFFSFMVTLLSALWFTGGEIDTKITLAKEVVGWFSPWVSMVLAWYYSEKIRKNGK